MDALLKPALLWPVPVPEIIALLATALMPGPGLVLMPGPGLVLMPGPGLVLMLEHGLVLMLKHGLVLMPEPGLVLMTEPGLVFLPGHCSILCWVVRAAVMPSWRHVTGMSKSGDWA